MSLSGSEIARSAFGSSASATAVGDSRERTVLDAMPNVLRPDPVPEDIFATGAAPAGACVECGAANLRVIFGSTVLLKRSLLGFATGRAAGRGAELSLEA